MENKETEKQKYSGFDSIYNHLPHISSKFWTFFNFKTFWHVINCIFLNAYKDLPLSFIWHLGYHKNILWLCIWAGMVQFGQLRNQWSPDSPNQSNGTRSHSKDSMAILGGKIAFFKILIKKYFLHMFSPHDVFLG